MSTKPSVVAILLRMDRIQQMYKAAAEEVRMSGTRKKALLQYKKAEPFSLTGVEVDQLRQDLSDQLKVRATQDAVQVVPDTEVQQKLVDVVDKGNAQQTRQGLLQGAKGGLLGAGAGAAAGGLAKGLPGAGVGLLSGGVPAAMHGYREGKTRAQDEQMRGLLAERYQEPEPPKVAADLDDLLENLFPRESSKRPPITSMRSESPKSDLPTFRTRQGQGTLRGKLRGAEKETSKGLIKKPGMLGEGAKKSLKAPKSPGFFRTTVKGRPKSVAVAGGLAALGVLGITAAKLQEYRNKRRQS